MPARRDRRPRPGAGSGRPRPPSGRKGGAKKQAPRAGTGDGRPTGAGGAAGKGRPAKRPSGGTKRAAPGGRDRRSRDQERRGAAPPDDPRTERAGWGSVARRGARSLGPPPSGSASEAWRGAVARSRGGRDADRHSGPPPAWEPEQWVDDDAVRGEAKRAVGRGGATGNRRTAPPRRPTPEVADVRPELDRSLEPRRAGRLAKRMQEAARAFERERFVDARRILGPLAREAPGAETVRELHGLTLYRLGKYRDAIRELEAFRTLTGSTEQHPVLADCYRALGRHREVGELWDELRQASPGAALVTEGRIVVAGALADRGDVEGAIRLLQQGPVDPKKPKHHHLRLWYALADLHERAGDVPRARDLFERVARHDRDFADLPERLQALS